MTCELSVILKVLPRHLPCQALRVNTATLFLNGIGEIQELHVFYNRSHLREKRNRAVFSNSRMRYWWKLISLAIANSESRRAIGYRAVPPEPAPLQDGLQNIITRMLNFSKKKDISAVFGKNFLEVNRFLHVQVPRLKIFVYLHPRDPDQRPGPPD